MHIVIYVLDALRADHLGCYGYARETSPHIDTLARDSALFERCYTSTTWTRPVAASILTGVYPGVHLTRSRSERFATALARLPQPLSEAGYATAAFSTMGNIASDIGFGEGFDSYYDLFRHPDILARRENVDGAHEGLMFGEESRIALPRAEDINDFFLPWLDQHRDDSTFSFIWSIETHAPYDVPESFRHFSKANTQHRGAGTRDDLRGAGPGDRQRLIDLYDDEIRYNDHCIGQIVTQLKETGLYDDTLLIIVGDHGEAFYEHGFYGHGQLPYNELLHVPLIIKFPGGQHAGQRVSALAELIDIFPTVLSVAGVLQSFEGRKHVQGQDLLPLLDGSRQSVREYAFSDTQSLDIHNRYLSVQDERYKYIRVLKPERDSSTLLATARHVLARGMARDIIRRPRHFLRQYFRRSGEYLFDLRADPAEQINLAAREPERTRHYRAVVEAQVEENDQRAAEAGSSTLDYEESEQLRKHLEQLGYL